MLKIIISGGQTGADRAGLEAASVLKFQTGGFCPKGYLTESGKDISLKKFGLKQVRTPKYEERTIKNVLSGDGTVIFCRLGHYAEIIGDGSKLTFETAVKNNKPVIVNPSKRKFLKWLTENDIEVLNVAGNRESQYPGIFKKTKIFLIKALSEYE
jgi:hypothetical protein